MLSNTMKLLGIKKICILVLVSALGFIHPEDANAKKIATKQITIQEKNETRQQTKSQIIVDTVRRVSIDIEHIKQADKKDIKFFFRLDDHTFDKNFAGNANEIASLDTLMQKPNLTFGLDSLVLVGSASIDGEESKNIELSRRRSESVKQFLLSRYSIFKADEIKTKHIGEDWQGLRDLIVADKNVPHKVEALEIIDKTDRSADARGWLLQQAKNGEIWEYLKLHILPKTRYGASLLFYYNMEQIKNLSYRDSLVYREVAPATKYIYKPMFALKTNLLYDALTLLNVELEIPIGNKWSVSAEWIGPWWQWDNGKADSKRHRIETKIGVVEGRYWFGDRVQKPILSGWFAGAYGAGGSFDFEYQREGVQSKNMISAGFVAGYAHTINKKGNLRLEYELGLGFEQHTHKKYTAEFVDNKWWLAYRDETIKRNWFGPTKLEFSLVWLLNRKVKVKE